MHRWADARFSAQPPAKDIILESGIGSDLCPAFLRLVHLQCHEEEALSKPAILALEDGSIFKGTAIGADGESVGEVVFNTSMTGYQEILTDSSVSGFMTFLSRTRSAASIRLMILEVFFTVS